MIAQVLAAKSHLDLRVAPAKLSAHVMQIDQINFTYSFSETQCSPRSEYFQIFLHALKIVSARVISAFFAPAANEKWRHAIGRFHFSERHSFIVYPHEASG
jgi:hypothetical protein